MFSHEPGTGKQVLHLETKQIAHAKGLNQALLPTVPMSDVVDQLDIVDLIELIVQVSNALVLVLLDSIGGLLTCGGHTASADRSRSN